MPSILENCEGFEWDEGNSNKNWHRHRIMDSECEEIFSNFPLSVVIDKGHSNREQRFQALGLTNSKRRLFVAFTIRGPMIRVISAREMNKKETCRYEEEIKRNT